MPLNDVPLPLNSQNLQNTQDPIRQNFLNIGSGFSVDHQAFASTNAGFHNKLTMPQQVATPVGVANTAVISFFTDNELYLNKNNTTAIPFTKSVKTTSGYTWLPSGILMQWKRTGAGAGANNNIAFPITFPNACLSVQLTADNPTPPAQPIITLTGFIAANYSFYAQSAPVGTGVTVFAIGY